jgi:redox-sensitive bicupin YhaK (pirin superfamily)
MIQLHGMVHDLGGGLKVRRLLPQRAKRMVGPFAFLDHMGPVTAAPEQNTDVRPHPHIGLSTLTYLFEGRIHHRDSLGSSQLIEPGEVNWMTAGRGISHSERTPESLRGKTRPLHGLQFWVALPDGKEEIDPAFFHYSGKDIPLVEDDQKRIHLVCGEAFGVKSPVATTSPMVFASIESKRHHGLELGSQKFEFAVYVVEGECEIDGVQFPATSMLHFDQGESGLLHFKEGSRFVLIGGEPFATKRHVWWNLVSSSREKIEETKRRWKEGTFPMVPGETEFIPLPES